MSDARPANEFDRPCAIAHDYGWDVGTTHVIDYYLWLADLPIRRFAESSRTFRFSPADWSR